MAKKTPGLDSAYSLKTPADSIALYRDWAATYDTEFAEGMDYRLPRHLADAFAAAYDGDGPVLDVGAGTGLVAQHGIGPIEGTDISEQMLAVAGQKRLYSRVFVGDVTGRLDVDDARYAGILSAGTFTMGHVGPDALDEVLRIAMPGALIAITVNAAHWTGAGFAAKFDALGAGIRDLSVDSTAIYGGKTPGDHAGDRGKIVLFRKV